MLVRNLVFEALELTFSLKVDELLSDSEQEVSPDCCLTCSPN
jgi:hypothetical protein